MREIRLGTEITGLLGRTLTALKDTSPNTPPQRARDSRGGCTSQQDTEIGTAHDDSCVDKRGDQLTMVGDHFRGHDGR
jgi:hypothetical protein